VHNDLYCSEPVIVSSGVLLSYTQECLDYFSLFFVELLVVLFMLSFILICCPWSCHPSDRSDVLSKLKSGIIIILSGGAEVCAVIGVSRAR
jgi:hypothetical protein